MKQSVDQLATKYRQVASVMLGDTQDRAVGTPISNYLNLIAKFFGAFNEGQVFLSTTPNRA